MRRTEQAIAANRRDTDAPSELDVAAPLGVVSEDEWRRHWPSADGAEPLDIPAVPEVVSDDDMVDVDDLVDDIELDEPEPDRQPSTVGLSMSFESPAQAHVGARSAEQRRTPVVPVAQPGGQAKIPLPVWVMYSLSASRRASSVCIGMNWVSGLRTNAMKNSPASRCPKPSVPSVKL